jgi:hypothetical protein
VATYCYRCPDCGAALTGTDRALNDGAVHCSTPIVRDYRAEAVGFATASLAHEREFGMRSHQDQFLPSAKDYAGPSDPDGQKGLRAWRESVTPKSENKRPATPSGLDKKVF